MLDLLWRKYLWFEIRPDTVIIADLRSPEGDLISTSIVWRNFDLSDNPDDECNPLRNIPMHSEMSVTCCNDVPQYNWTLYVLQNGFKRHILNVNSKTGRVTTNATRRLRSCDLVTTNWQPPFKDAWFKSKLAELSSFLDNISSDDINYDNVVSWLERAIVFACPDGDDEDDDEPPPPGEDDQPIPAVDWPEIPIPPPGIKLTPKKRIYTDPPVPGEIAFPCTSVVPMFVRVNGGYSGLLKSCLEFNYFYDGMGQCSPRPTTNPAYCYERWGQELGPGGCVVGFGTKLFKIQGSGNPCVGLQFGNIDVLSSPPCEPCTSAATYTEDVIGLLNYNCDNGWIKGRESEMYTYIGTGRYNSSLEECSSCSRWRVIVCLRSKYTSRNLTTYFEVDAGSRPEVDTSGDYPVVRVSGDEIGPVGFAMSTWLLYEMEVCHIFCIRP